LFNVKKAKEVKDNRRRIQEEKYKTQIIITQNNIINALTSKWKGKCIPN